MKIKTSFHFALLSTLCNFVSVKRYYVLLFLLLIGLFLLSLLAGSVPIGIDKVLHILAGDDTQPDALRFIVRESRLPQAVTAALTGSALGTCGLLLQTAFRNPLAGPSVFGIDSGASLGVAIVMLAIGGSVVTSLGSLTGLMAILLSAFVGAIVITLILMIISELVRSHVFLLIVGIMVGYLASSAIVMLNFFSSEESLRSYMVWGMGNFSGVPMSHLPVFALLIAIGLTISLTLIKSLNAILLGEAYAENLGIDTKRLRLQLLFATGLLTAVTTAYCGPIAFLGLAVPHIARLCLHTDDHRVLLPSTMLTGAVVALLCNVLCSLSLHGSQMPLNALTPIVGAPIIIYVILKNRTL